MDEKMKTLQEMCETISRELADANEKIRRAGGKLSPGDVDYIDKLTHTLKSVKSSIAMMEDEDGGYSGHYPMFRTGYAYDGRSYAEGGRSDGYGGMMSNARGRTNARRDSMGRYSSDGYSRTGDMAERLRDMMNSAPDERTRQEIQSRADRLERM